MGISDLSKVIEKHSGGPGAYARGVGCVEFTTISNINGWKICIDVSIYVNAFFRSVGEKRWIVRFIHLIMKLRQHNVSCFCIFDGKNKPIEKLETQSRRRESQNKIREKHEKVVSLMKSSGLERLSKLIDRYNEQNDNEDDDADYDVSCKELMKRMKLFVSEKLDIEKVAEIEELVKFTNPDPFGEGRTVSGCMGLIAEVRATLEKWYLQFAPITDEMMDMAREALDFLGVPHHTSPGEAENMCASLCIAGIVQGVLTEDTDLLAYLCPTIIRRLKTDINNPTIEIVHLDRLCRSLDMDYFSFRDFCILLGCDYNTRIRGNGPVSAEKIIRKHKTIEEYADASETLTQEDLDLTKYERCRELFTPMEIKMSKKLRFPAMRSLDKKAMAKFFDKYQKSFNLNIGIRQDQIIEAMAPRLKIVVSD